MKVSFVQENFSMVIFIKLIEKLKLTLLNHLLASSFGLPKYLMVFPIEIIDEIIARTDFHTAIRLKNDYAIKWFYENKPS